ncbi:hypothetical protein AYO21_07921 [Fonsecaea monophora]|uniref:Heterokaryon incompatibility domain-containing protein n=1 Tax=Fonsecaea monophora TaxID=254056 RepID=A0A177F0K4_9EURO|nr:hypothetical protein AYO21_07921 [Fonsecaea monophora]KAH0843783.1 hypothetical protein FOPE_08580 [Fonsecaea pedrosoi]OAG37815.1 hypothetical protein AYO21_07921 [Fonsecaea monophora]
MSGNFYQPLNRSRREIRLILLHNDDQGLESRDSPNSPLRCQLITTSLTFYDTKFDIDAREVLSAASPQINGLYTLYALYKLFRFAQRNVPRILQQKPSRFYALSYVWGDPTRLSDIEVNGQVARIPENLAEGLRSIRANTNIRVIWADAICINQQDNEEKSWQIQEMATIYKRAACVISWLGRGTAESDLAFAALRKFNFGHGPLLSRLVDQVRPCSIVVAAIGYAILMIREGFMLPHAGLGSSRTFRKIVAISEDAISTLLKDVEHLDAVLSLANLVYWSRMWIFQEFACARKRLFLCGDSLTDNLDLALESVMHWRGLSGASGESKLHAALPPMITAANNLGFRRWKCYLGPRLASRIGPKVWQLLSRYREHDAPVLLSLLRQLHLLHATDARDHVYALISVAADRRELHITPDYAKSVEVVFTEITSALLRHGNLDTLLDATRSEPRPDLPSWVPYWSNLSEPGFDPHLYRLHGSSNWCQRCAGLDTSRFPDLIHLDGFIVDEIVLVGDTYRGRISRNSDGPNEKPLKLLKSWLDSIGTAIWDHDRYVKDQNEQEASARERITADLLLTATVGLPAKTELALPILSLTGLLTNLAKSTRLQKEVVRELTFPKIESEEIWLAQYVTKVVKLLSSPNAAQPFRTLTGYSCLAAHDRCRVGDLVVIIPGVGIPLVVRNTGADCTPSRHIYRLIDQAYVHGIMYGEFFKQKPRPKLEKLALL